VSKVPITVEGAEKMRAELEQRKFKDRARITESIATARAHGDLKENAEYHAAREEQSFNEGRIKDLESKLSNAQIIDVTKVNANGRVVFGSTVDLVEVESGEEVTYKIVGEDEADLKLGMISITSPIARALIGKQVDDVAVVNAPSGAKEYEIVDIRYE
jgi:transcription elongation factor GreA